MAYYKTLQALGTVPMPIPTGPGVVACRMSYTFGAAFALNELLELGTLPANCVPVDFIVDTDDLGTAGALSLGVINSGKTDLDGTAWATAIDVNTAAAGIRATSAQLLLMNRLAPSSDDRVIGFKATTATTAAGTLGLTLFYRLA